MPQKEILRVYFFPGTDHTGMWLRRLLPEYEILEDDQNPDIIFLNTRLHGRAHHRHALRQMVQARRRFGMRPLLCSDHGEVFPRPALRGLDYLFSYAPTGGRNCLRGLIGEWEAMERRRSEPEFVERQKRLSDPRGDEAGFCSFIYSGRRYPSVRVRGYFCRLLSRYKKVDCPGESHNNMPRLISYWSSGGPEAKLDFIASRRFTIAFENISAEYYLTEKIFHPLSVGSVPIYWGCRRVAEYINPECFINCRDFGSFAEVVEKVREVDRNPELYAGYQNAPPILPGSRLHEIRRDMRRHALRMAEEALERRKRKNEYPNLRQLAALALRNAGAARELLPLPPPGDLAALADLAPLCREILRSRSWNL